MADDRAARPSSTGGSASRAPTAPIETITRKGKDCIDGAVTLVKPSDGTPRGHTVGAALHRSIITFVKILNCRMERKSVSAPGVLPLQFSRSMGMTRVQINADLLHCSQQGLNGIDTSRLASLWSSGPADLVFAFPMIFLVDRKMNSDRDVEFAASLHELQVSIQNNHCSYLPPKPSRGICRPARQFAYRSAACAQQVLLLSARQTALSSAYCCSHSASDFRPPPPPDRDLKRLYSPRRPLVASSFHGSKTLSGETGAHHGLAAPVW
jgi:hypothetical protein